MALLPVLPPDSHTDGKKVKQTRKKAEIVQRIKKTKPQKPTNKGKNVV